MYGIFLFKNQIRRRTLLLKALFVVHTTMFKGATYYQK